MNGLDQGTMGPIYYVGLILAFFSLLLSILLLLSETKGSGSNNNVYNRGFRSMLDSMDDEDCIEESGLIGEKKRRLSIEQVKTLEKSFEVENKLEPERKVTLARELGLQPRQVAVWFQNRRARWKTKQLEKDYGLLKSDYESLKLNFDTLRRDNEALSVEIKELKSKLGVKNVENGCRVKQEIIQSESKNRVLEQSKMEDDIDQSHEHCDGGLMMFGDFKDGSSDSDSSAILNEDNGPYSAISCEILHPNEQPVPSILRFDCASSSHSSINYLQFSDYPRIASNTQKAYHQTMKMEENNLLTGGDEHCNFFEEEQAPSLSWYCPEQWI